MYDELSPLSSPSGYILWNSDSNPDISPTIRNSPILGNENLPLPCYLDTPPGLWSSLSNSPNTPSQPSPLTTIFTQKWKNEFSTPSPIFTENLHQVLPSNFTLTSTEHDSLFNTPSSPSTPKYVMPAINSPTDFETYTTSTPDSDPPTKSCIAILQKKKETTTPTEIKLRYFDISNC